MSNKVVVARWRRRLKQRAIEYKGGVCLHCGELKPQKYMHFHHRDPQTKEFGIAAGGITRSWERVQAELDKCDLLCKWCHEELHCKVA